MPHYWIIYATPESIHDMLQAGNWSGARDEIGRVLRRPGWTFDEVYFDPGERKAYVLLHTDEDADLSDADAAQYVEVFTEEELRPPSESA